MNQTDETSGRIRLQKYLAQMAVASRRKSEEFIKQGLIKVNGEVVTEMGVKVDPKVDKIEVDPSLNAREQELIYIMLNKPAGIVTSCAEHLKDKTVVDLVDVPERVFPIGRLDKATTGLLILTNDGRITQQLLHPTMKKEKEYEVLVDKVITPEQVKKLESGVNLFGAPTAPTKVRILSKKRMRITLTEGKNRQVRRICRKVGLYVNELKRVRMNKLWLDEKLPEGQWRKLSKAELALLVY